MGFQSIASSTESTSTASTYYTLRNFFQAKTSTLDKNIKNTKPVEVDFEESIDNGSVTGDSRATA